GADGSAVRLFVACSTHWSACSVAPRGSPSSLGADSASRGASHKPNAIRTIPRRHAADSLNNTIVFTLEPPPWRTCLKESVSAPLVVSHPYISLEVAVEPHSRCTSVKLRVGRDFTPKPGGVRCGLPVLVSRWRSAWPSRPGWPRRSPNTTTIT